MADNNELKVLEGRAQKGIADINCYFRLASLYFEEGDFEKVLSLYNGISEKKLTSIEHARVLREKGVASQLLNRIEDALSLFRASLNKAHNLPDSIEVLDIRGLDLHSIFDLTENMEEKMRCASEAIDCFNKLKIDYKVREEEYLVNSYLADIYVKIGQYDNALSLYKEIIEESTDIHDSVWALVGVASIFELKGEYQNSFNCLTDALKQAGNTVPTSKIYFDLGKLHFAENEYEAAKEAFQKALSKMKAENLLKNNEEYKNDILWHLGMIAYNLEEDNVIFYFSDILKRIETDHLYYPNINITIGHFYIKENSFQKARYYYERALLSETISEEEQKMAEECLAKLSDRWV